MSMTTFQCTLSCEINSVRLHVLMLLVCTYVLVHFYTCTYRTMSGVHLEKSPRGQNVSQNVGGGGGGGGFLSVRVSKQQSTCVGL